MGMIDKLIDIRVQLTDKFSSPMQKIEQNMKKANTQAARQNTIFRKMNATQKASKERVKTLAEQQHGFGQVMGMSMHRFKEFNAQGFKFNTIGGRTANRIRMLTHGMRGFRMEMLGVMFFGMAILRMFGGLTRTSMEWFGVTEILTPALGLLFMPIGEFMSGAALTFLNWVTDLTDAQKDWINIIIVTVIVIGAFLMMVGTLALGIGSMIFVFEGVGAAAAMFGTVAAVLGGVILIVSGIIMVISGRMEGLGLIIMGIGLILILFIGWWALIPIAIGLAVFLIIKYWSNFKDWFKILWMSIKAMWTLVHEGMFNVVKIIWNGIVSHIEASINAVVWALNKLIRWINKVPGVNIPIIPKLDLGFAKAELTDLTALAARLKNEISTEKMRLGAIRQAEELAKKAEDAEATAAADDRKQSSAFGDKIAPVNITNIFNGFTNEDLKKELDSRDSNMVSQMERNR